MLPSCRIWVDVNIADWSNDSQTARFSQEGYQEQYIAHVKSLTTNPGGVGRYTSPTPWCGHQSA